MGVVAFFLIRVFTSFPTTCPLHPRLKKSVNNIWGGACQATVSPSAIRRDRATGRADVESHTRHGGGGAGAELVPGVALLERTN